MSTFLELCQEVARESGTVSGTQPTTVTGQTGRLLKVVNFTANAWDLIQNAHKSWRWMRDDFSVSISSGTQRYTATALGLTDWGAWITDQHLLTLYKTSTGVSDEGELTFINWSDFRRMYVRGSQTNNRPVHYSISPAGELCFGPTPDDTYTVNSEYRKTTQRLSADADEPNCPARFHALIKHVALMLLAEHDEANFAVAAQQLRHLQLFSALEADQLPMDELISFAAPLA